MFCTTNGGRALCGREAGKGGEWRALDPTQCASSSSPRVKKHEDHKQERGRPVLRALNLGAEGRTVLMPLTMLKASGKELPSSSR